MCLLPLTKVSRTAADRTDPANTLLRFSLATTAYVPACNRYPLLLFPLVNWTGQGVVYHPLLLFEVSVVALLLFVVCVVALPSCLVL